MKNQIVLVTGALTGIGRATALAFAQEGANFVVSGRQDDKGRDTGGRTAPHLRLLKAEFIQFGTDGFTNHDEEEVKGYLVEKTVKRFGRYPRHRRPITPVRKESRGPIVEQSAENLCGDFRRQMSWVSS